MNNEPNNRVSSLSEINKYSFTVVEKDIEPKYSGLVIIPTKGIIESTPATSITPIKINKANR